MVEGCNGVVDVVDDDAAGVRCVSPGGGGSASCVVGTGVGNGIVIAAGSCAEGAGGS